MTQVGQRGWNCPCAVDDETFEHFDPDMVSFYRVKYEPGDLVMAVSDGITDNLWPLDICQHRTPEALAASYKAGRYSYSDYPIPFIQGHKRSFKYDDVSIIFKQL